MFPRSRSCQAYITWFCVPACAAAARSEHQLRVSYTPGVINGRMTETSSFAAMSAGLWNCAAEHREATDSWRELSPPLGLCAAQSLIRSLAPQHQFLTMETAKTFTEIRLPGLKFRRSTRPATRSKRLAMGILWKVPGTLAYKTYHVRPSRTISTSWFVLSFSFVFYDVVVVRSFFLLLGSLASILYHDRHSSTLFY